VLTNGELAPSDGGTRASPAPVAGLGWLLPCGRLSAAGMQLCAHESIFQLHSGYLPVDSRVALNFTSGLKVRAISAQILRNRQRARILKETECRGPPWPAADLPRTERAGGSRPTPTGQQRSLLTNENIRHWGRPGSPEV
jgi:hypothetical protein